MAASRAEISSWFDRGLAEGSTHMIVVCDTFDYDDYPVFASGDADALEKHDEYRDKSMQRVMEVYDLRLDKAAQMDQARVNNLPARQTV